MKSKPPILSFNVGELGKHSLARVDLENAPRGAEIMENIIPLVEGGMSKAPGTVHIGETASSASDTLTIVRPWVYSESEAFVLELSEYDLRLQYRDQGRVQVASDGGATLGAWGDQSAPEETGGGAPPSGSTGTTGSGGTGGGGYGGSGGSSGGGPNGSFGNALEQY